MTNITGFYFNQFFKGELEQRLLGWDLDQRYSCRGGGSGVGGEGDSSHGKISFAVGTNLKAQFWAGSSV